MKKKTAKSTAASDKKELVVLRTYLKQLKAYLTHVDKRVAVLERKVK